MKKLVVYMALFLSLMGHAYAIVLPSPQSHHKLINNDMKMCYNKLNELKRFNPREFKTLNNKLMTVVQNLASLNSSGQYVTSETMQYIIQMQTKSIEMTCEQIEQKLDIEIVKKGIAPLI